MSKFSKLCHFISSISATSSSLSIDFCVKGIKVVPEINGAWQRELQDYNRHVPVNSIDLSIPNTFFDLSRTGLDTILAGADVALSLDRFTLDAGNERYYNHFFTLELAASL